MPGKHAVRHLLQWKNNSDLINTSKSVRRGHREDAGGVGDHGGGLREGGSGGPGEPHHLHLRPQDPALSRDGQPGRRGDELLSGVFFMGSDG